MAEALYLLPGRGGYLNRGLGASLAHRGYAIVGRELRGKFQELAFREQVRTVAQDLKADFWHVGARIVANSFGAYLFLHAQASLDPYPGRVLLLSPILGEAECEETMMGYVPPDARRLWELTEHGNYAAPRSCEIHVGELDWQSNPERVLSFASLIGARVSIVPRVGHSLGVDYVSGVLDCWLAARG